MLDQATVLLTDRAWPDDRIERQVIEAAGHRLIAGPASAVPADQVLQLVRETQPAAIMTCWAQVSAAAISAANALRIVARLGVGLDNIAVDAATAHGAWVTNVPDYCVEEVSDHALALLLGWARGVVPFDAAVKAGRWEPAGAQLRRVSTLTVGVIGHGRIGRRLTDKLQPFGCRLLAHVRSPRSAEPGLSFVPLDTLLAESDVVVIVAPLTPQTHHLMDRARLALMKRGACLINVSRGAVVETQALIDALQCGHLSGAALDVLESEPAVPRELLAHPGVVLTPHVAFSSDASIAELRRRAAEDVVRVLRGEAPEQPCNRPVFT